MVNSMKENLKHLWMTGTVSAFLAMFLLFSMIYSATKGTVTIPLHDAYAAVVFGLTGSTTYASLISPPVFDIIWMLRLPRIVLAMVTGMGLSVCGVIMQAIVKNPLADPYILGVSSGASLGATAAILLGIGTALGENFVGLVASGGAFAVSLGVLILSNCGGRPNSIKLLLSGMALSAVCGAFSSFIVYFANNIEGMQTIAYWLMGSFANAKWENLIVICFVVLAGTLFFWSQHRVLNLMLLGDETAITLGTDLNYFRQCYLVVSALIVGFVVYSAGMIGFVGLIIPHIVRTAAGTDHKALIPLSALSGAVFLVWSDLLCRSVIPRAELPIGVFISLIGAPCFIYLMVRRGYGFGGKDS